MRTVRLLALTITTACALVAIIAPNVGSKEVKNKAQLVYCANPTPTPTPAAEPERERNEWVAYYCKYFKPYCLDDVQITYIHIEYESLGKYFITAYCPAECGGSWQTASGIRCHRADYEHRLTEPTTCAVDPKLHRIGSSGDLFYVSAFDRVFRAEDTGSAVKNKHLDLFYEEYSDVVSFPTGYYQVYSVEYKTSSFRAGDYKVNIGGLDHE